MHNYCVIMRILVTFITLYRATYGLQDDLVTTLPGYGPPPSTMYSGHLPVDDTTRGVNLFYIFTSRTVGVDDGSVPILVWFQGGGGASPPWGNQSGPFSLDGYAGGGPSTFGMLCEYLGPFNTPDNSSGSWVLEDNPFSWTRFAHVLFIDQPAGVGLSYFNQEDHGWVADGTQLGHDVAEALLVFFERHPDLKMNPLFLFGESYAGHYVPHITSFIMDHGGESRYKGLRSQLTGIGLGDVCPGEEHDMTLAQYMHGLGYVDDTQLYQAKAMISRCKTDLWKKDYHAAFISCNAMEVFKGLASGGIHDQDSRYYANYSSLVDLVNVDGATSEGRWEALANAWLDEPSVRKALHALKPNRSIDPNQPNTTRGLWKTYDGQRTTLNMWPRFISELKVLVYNGNFDVSCGFMATNRFLSTLGNLFKDPKVGQAYTKAWQSTERRWFTVNSSMAGYWRSIKIPEVMKGSLLRVIIQGAGHLAPRDQPARVGAMLERFLTDQPLCDEKHGVCRGSDVSLISLGDRCALMMNCSGHGKCSDEAKCICDDGYVGADCSQNIDPLVISKPYLVSPGSWKYHKISSSIEITITSTDALILYVAPHSSWPPPPEGLLTTFVQAFRLQPSPLSIKLPANSIVGIYNEGPSYAAPVLSYSFSKILNLF